MTRGMKRIRTDFDGGFAVLVRGPAVAGATAHAHATARPGRAHHGAHRALNAAGGRAGRRGYLHRPRRAVGGEVVCGVGDGRAHTELSGKWRAEAPKVRIRIRSVGRGRCYWRRTCADVRRHGRCAICATAAVVWGAASMGRERGLGYMRFGVCVVAVVYRRRVPRALAATGCGLLNLVPGVAPKGRLSFRGATTGQGPLALGPEDRRTRRALARRRRAADFWRARGRWAAGGGALLLQARGFSRPGGVCLARRISAARSPAPTQAQVLWPWHRRSRTWSLSRRAGSRYDPSASRPRWMLRRAEFLFARGLIASPPPEPPRACEEPPVPPSERPRRCICRVLLRRPPPALDMRRRRHSTSSPA